MKNLKFENFKDFFLYQQNRMAAQVGDRKADTLARLVKKLGYKSPSLLSMISKGQRLPSAALLEALMDKWEIAQADREGIRIQVEIERRVKKDKEVLHLVDRLNRIHGKATFQCLDINQFQSVSKWYVYVIREMIAAPNFVEDPNFIARKLRGKVTPAEVKKAIEALLSVGLIRRLNNGDLKVVEENIETTNGIPSEAIQEHHKSMMERAIESIKEQPVSDRHLHTLTFRFDPLQSSEAQKKIIEFIKYMNEKYESKGSERIFQLNVQFFEHTKSKEALSVMGDGAKKEGEQA